MDNWFTGIAEDSLLDELPSPLVANIRAMEAQGIDLDTIGQIFSNNPSADLIAKGGTGWPSNLWQLTKGELQKIFCTNDPKYTSLRDDLNKQTNVTSAVLLGMISSAVTSKLGLEAGLVTPFVVILLITLIRAGKEAWCTQMQASPPIQK